jgi:hypothetical protein
MSRGTVRVAGLGVAMLAALAGCGQDRGPVAAPPSSAASERARLLATCPAEVRPWYENLPPVTPDAETMRRQETVKRAAGVAHSYLDRLPVNQVGQLRTEQHRMTVVVQVTRAVDAERVRRDLQDRVGDGVSVEVETVRWSQVELEGAAETIKNIPGLTWSGMGAGADGHVEVAVPGDVATARALIAEKLDPCMFTVEQGTVTPAG